MAFDDLTTRRIIVKTGVKLAYAAPLVAATMKLTSGNAGAAPVSGPACVEQPCGLVEIWDPVSCSCQCDEDRCLAAGGCGCSDDGFCVC